jgi:hypothetical protein
MDGKKTNSSRKSYESSRSSTWRLRGASSNRYEGSKNSLGKSSSRKENKKQKKDYREMDPQNKKRKTYDVITGAIPKIKNIIYLDIVL